MKRGLTLFVLLMLAMVTSTKMSRVVSGEMVRRDVRCTTQYNRVLSQYETTCSDGTRMITKYHHVLDRYETTVRKRTK